MSPETQKNTSHGTKSKAQPGEKVAVFIFGIVFVIVMFIIAIFFPHPSDFQIFVFRVILALAAAGVGAIIPGFILVKVSNYVRAGGALALFVLIYLFNPPSLVITRAPEHEGYLGTLHKHFNALPNKEFSLILADKELHDFWIDGVYSGKNWSDVLTKICENPSHSCLECDPPPGKIENIVKISIAGGPKNIRNISTGIRPRYVCP